MPGAGASLANVHAELSYFESESIILIIEMIIIISSIMIIIYIYIIIAVIIIIINTCMNWKRDRQMPNFYHGSAV